MGQQGLQGLSLRRRIIILLKFSCREWEQVRRRNRYWEVPNEKRSNKTEDIDSSVQGSAPHSYRARHRTAVDPGEGFPLVFSFTMRAPENQWV